MVGPLANVLQYGLARLDPSHGNASAWRTRMQRTVMDDNIGEFVKRIRALEAQIEQEFQQRRQQLQADFENRKVQFEAEVLAQQRRFKEGVLKYVLTADWRHVLSVPFIYPVLLPMLLLDAFVTLYRAFN
jgi:hypothetical protein